MIRHVVIITGERDWTDSRVVFSEMYSEWARSKGAGDSDVHFVLGDCPTGVDAIALALCKERGWPYDVVPVDPRIPWPAKGPERNGRMVQKGIELRQGAPIRWLAFWSGKEKKSGTYDCFRQATAAGCDGRVIARN